MKTGFKVIVLLSKRRLSHRNNLHFSHTNIFLFGQDPNLTPFYRTLLCARHPDITKKFKKHFVYTFSQHPTKFLANPKEWIQPCRQERDISLTFLQIQSKLRKTTMMIHACSFYSVFLTDEHFYLYNFPMHRTSSEIYFDAMHFKLRIVLRCFFRHQTQSFGFLFSCFPM